MLLIRCALRIMYDFVHTFRMRELIFGWEMERVWVCGLRDWEVGPGGEGVRHCVLSSLVDCWGGLAQAKVEKREGRRGQRWGKERIKYVKGKEGKKDRVRVSSFRLENCPTIIS